MSESKIQCVLFDAGGTLIGTNTDSEYWFEQFFVDACAEQGCVVTVHQVHDVLRRAARSRQFDSRASSDAEARAFWQHIYTAAFADLLGAKAVARTPAFIDHLAADYIDRFETGEFIRLFPDTQATLEMLAQQNVKMGIVSNFSTYLHDFLKRLAIDHYFDFTICSAGEGCEKPGDEIFHRALKRCNGVNPDQLLFVGDHPDEDYRPARNHGMHALLIDRHDRYADQEDLLRIPTLTHVPNFVDTGSLL